MNCGECFYLEYLDGVGFCNYYQEDVILGDLCEHFMNYEDTKNLLMHCYGVINDNCGSCDVMMDNIDEFMDIVGNLL